ncbi:hypothetical protein FCH28_11700 [Streptomyces piniterrae]|uniref:Uncharacterized protein n=1 Tax=Streptomyces piniterrae TaxID=2571125 RepID=A0A4U0NZV9_9ACTN|nr:hypothetical protein [Streptomyces piniterrae]TJZ55934.1 hypothetical protein FCH28_11700 [Streptomyces piniterrae]
MVIRLRRPWRARLAVVLAALALAAVGATMLWHDAPAPYQPERWEQWEPHRPGMAVVYQIAFREEPPGPVTITGAVLLAGALALPAGCLFIRRRQ